MTPTTDQGVEELAKLAAGRFVTDFETDLRCVLNAHSAENASNTPDHILAQFLLGCLAAWDVGVQQRETWYGRDARPTAIDGPLPPSPGDEK